MRGGHGDAAKRQVADVASSRGVGNGVPDKFADYARFDDMFGASRIFTDGTARQRKKETEMYVKDVMERRVYGYTHDLRMHGEPLLRIPVGAPLDEQPSSRGKENPVAREDDRKRRDLEGPESKATGGRKKARMSPGAGAFAQGAGVKPSPRAGAGFGVGRGRHSDVNGITASLFEREDWETDPLWAAMEEAVANGGVGSLEELPLPGSAMRATALAPHPTNFDGEFMQRSRFEEIEERIHNLENSLALARAAAGTERHAPGSLPVSQTAADAAAAAGGERARGEFGSDRGSGGKSPQSPSPHNWAPMNPSRSSDLICDAATGRIGSGGGSGDGARHAGGGGGGGRRSNSFTSTPGPKHRVGSVMLTESHPTHTTGGAFIDEDARALAMEYERLREDRDANRREHELLRTEFEHAKSQTALLRESNRNYEARVEQLERLVRECNAQTSSLRSQLAEFTAAGGLGGSQAGGWVPPAPITTVKATSRSRGSGDPNSAGATPRVPTPRVNFEVNHINTQTQAQNNPGQLKRVGSCFMSGTAAAAAARSVSLRPSLAQVSPDSSAGEFDGVGHLHVGAR
ncbi:predicted protein [Micromonas commoda]|uniref:Uncharacterized protein n=1 Tax=Micromonas commoda (strain RCC299 / NOUM17 / CCMP2709) TaxID=296587 RepID=C1FGX6_MICCC|nr:predicted protein [Micromonas commoda]ACO69726.1 predicted protein [Micromonas commoda]|eukprot:XP_002508468.1 predicted protein [Micromonas commoda]